MSTSIGSTQALTSSQAATDFRTLYYASSYRWTGRGVEELVKSFTLRCGLAKCFYNSVDNIFEMTCVGTLFDAAVNDFRETIDDYVQQKLARAERTGLLSEVELLPECSIFDVDEDDNDDDDNDDAVEGGDDNDEKNKGTVSHDGTPSEAVTVRPIDNESWAHEQVIGFRRRATDEELDSVRIQSEYGLSIRDNDSRVSTKIMDDHSNNKSKPELLMRTTREEKHLSTHVSHFLKVQKTHHFKLDFVHSNDVLDGTLGRIIWPRADNFSEFFITRYNKYDHVKHDYFKVNRVATRAPLKSSLFNAIDHVTLCDIGDVDVVSNIDQCVATQLELKSKNDDIRRWTHQVPAQVSIEVWNEFAQQAADRRDDSASSFDDRISSVSRRESRKAATPRPTSNTDPLTIIPRTARETPKPSQPWEAKTAPYALPHSVFHAATPGKLSTSGGIQNAHFPALPSSRSSKRVLSRLCEPLPPARQQLPPAAVSRPGELLLNFSSENDASSSVNPPSGRSAISNTKSTPIVPRPSEFAILDIDDSEVSSEALLSPLESTKSSVISHAVPLLSVPLPTVPPSARPLTTEPLLTAAPTTVPPSSVPSSIMVVERPGQPPPPPKLRRTMRQRAPRPQPGDSSNGDSGQDTEASKVIMETYTMLDDARSFNGRVNVELQLGKILVNTLPGGISPPPLFPADFLASLIKLEEFKSSDSFTQALTRSWDDISFILGVFSVEPMLAKSGASYEIICRKTDQEKIRLVVDAVHASTKSYYILPPTMLGTAFFHFPQRVWDARLLISGTKIAETCKGAQSLVDSLYIRMQQGRAVVKGRDGDGLHVETVQLRKFADYVIAPDVHMHIEMVRELSISRPAINAEENVGMFQTAVEDEEAMAQQQTLWYEVSLRPSNMATCSNEDLQTGPADWKPFDIISQAALYAMCKLGTAVVEKMDCVGMNNRGPLYGQEQRHIKKAAEAPPADVYW